MQCQQGKTTIGTTRQNRIINTSKRLQPGDGERMAGVPAEYRGHCQQCNTCHQHFQKKLKCLRKPIHQRYGNDNEYYNLQPPAHQGGKLCQHEVMAPEAAQQLVGQPYHQQPEQVVFPEQRKFPVRHKQAGEQYRHSVKLIVQGACREKEKTRQKYPVTCKQPQTQSI